MIIIRTALPIIRQHFILSHLILLSRYLKINTMENKLLTIADVMSLTGLSRATIYMEVYKSKILGEGLPYKKFGPRLLRFDRDELLRWMDTRSQTYRSVNEAVELKRAKENAQKR